MYQLQVYNVVIRHMPTKRSSEKSSPSDSIHRYYNIIDYIPSFRKFLIEYLGCTRHQGCSKVAAQN